MFKLFTAVMAVFLCLPLGANAQTVLMKDKSDKCMPTISGVIMKSNFLDQVRKRTPEARIWDLSQSETLLYVDLLNASPPATNIQTPHTLVIVAVRNGVSRLGVIGFGKSGCAVLAGSVVNRLHKKIIEAVLGRVS